MVCIKSSFKKIYFLSKAYKSYKYGGHKADNYYGGHPAPAGPALPNLINAVRMLKSTSTQNAS